MNNSRGYINALLFLMYLFVAIFILLSMFLAILAEAQGTVRQRQQEAKDNGWSAGDPTAHVMNVPALIIQKLRVCSSAMRRSYVCSRARSVVLHEHGEYGICKQAYVFLLKMLEKMRPPKSGFRLRSELQQEDAGVPVPCSSAAVISSNVTDLSELATLDRSVTAMRGELAQAIESMNDYNFLNSHDSLPFIPTTPYLST